MHLSRHPGFNVVLLHDSFFVFRPSGLVLLQTLIFLLPRAYAYRGITRSSADADKPARCIWRSVKVTKHSTIPYVRYSFLLCNSNFVFKTRRFYDIPIFDFKNVVTLKWGSKVTQGH